MSNQIFVSNIGKSYFVLHKRIKTSTRKLLVFLGKKNCAVLIFLVDNGTMEKINRQYRRKNKATNVLSFENPEGFVDPPGSAKNLGEIYLAPDYIRAHNEDFNLMLIHGLLHLLGYGHEKKSDRIKMETKERQLIKKLTHN